LKEKNRALKAKDAARSNWIAGISHDIRTPLSMILGHASDLEESDHLPVEQKKQASVIRKQGEPLHRKVLKVSALVRQCASDFLNQGLAEPYSFELEIQDEQLKINGDEKLLLRALSNLVQNCIDHNPAGCRIRLQTTRSTEMQSCSITVWDDGQGIEQHALPGLTQLPYSAEKKYCAHLGRGLGLPMVARIAKAHDGELRLQSGKGEGLKAQLILPLESNN
jgi:signal transduction histidine kinase